MNRPSSRHLSHDYKAYKGLSLRELFWIVLLATPATSLLMTFIGFFLSYPLALGCVGFFLGFILAITIIPKWISRIKAGKPYGYVMKKTLLTLTHLGLKRSPYLHYQGAWQISKLVGQHDV
ncbi:conjugative transfer region protein [Legionella busanensis]|uniref:Conjugative transfer region protein n=1 Tax=Legionella busanensis TaxID=190655 RepID=A0A378JJK5_9GAMM|nr:TIGR03750 family conjugal transfer protein [Legionella busanensis]STX50931.1 conjugative transfer region protein [Legionella busanensis]